MIKRELGSRSPKGTVDTRISGGCGKLVQNEATAKGSKSNTA